MQRVQRHIVSRVLFTLMVIACVIPTANAIEFYVVDQHDKPLPNAVIEITTQSSEKETTQSDISVMDQIDKSFVPSVLLIQKNSQVDFPNSDNIRHHVYSFSTPKVFELKLYANQPESPIIFEQPGVVVLGCNIHDSMVGYIYVAKSNHAQQTNANGVAIFPANSNKLALVTVWHPQLASGVDSRKTVEISRIDDASPIKVVLDIAEVEARNTFEDVFK